MMRRLSAAISRQLSHPSGRGGRVIAALMNRGNRGLNTRAIELLDVQPDSRVLDLGFGGGLTFPLLLERAASVTGVDRAHDMVQAARARHADAIAAGRLTVHEGEVGALPLPDDAVDRILTVNTVYFWRDLPAAFAELLRVLAPGGRLVMGIRDGSVMDRVNPDVFTIRSADEIAAALTAAGFAAVEIVSAPDGKTHLLTGTAG
ncbi:MAG TPA: class I SAM-dependent methyltransferase [Solirubrobacteraceae bacterium]